MAKWRRRFLERRLDGLVDDPRLGRPASITTDQVEDVVVATLESTPKNPTHWIRITGGNFRLVDRLLTQIKRIQTLNHLDTVTPEIVDAARETLIIGR